MQSEDCLGFFWWLASSAAVHTLVELRECFLAFTYLGRRSTARHVRVVDAILTATNGTLADP